MRNRPGKRERRKRYPLDAATSLRPEIRSAGYIEDPSITSCSQTREVKPSLEQWHGLTEPFVEWVNEMYTLLPAGVQRTVAVGVTAQKVFDTAELLECILMNLSTRGKLRAMRVQRLWRNTILGSPKLKVALGLQIDPKAKFYSSPFPVDPSFARSDEHGTHARSYLPYGGTLFVTQRRKVKGEEALSDTIDISIRMPRPVRHAIPGTRIQAMQMFGTPLANLQGEMVCSDGLDSAMYALGSEASIDAELKHDNVEYKDCRMTVDALARMTQRLLRGHICCGSTSYSKCDVHVHWKATVALHKDDPLMQAAEEGKDTVRSD